MIDLALTKFDYGTNAALLLGALLLDLIKVGIGSICSNRNNDQSQPCLSRITPGDSQVASP